MNKEFLPWTAATPNFYNAILAAHAAIAYGYLVELRYLPNEKQESPLLEHNPALNDPFNWTSSCSFPESEDNRKKRINEAKSETEKDLIENWTTVFASTSESIELYKKERKVTKDLVGGMGRCIPVRIADLVEYLKAKGETERAEIFAAKRWVHLWTPAKDVPYWVPVKNVNTYGVYVKKPGIELTFEQLEDHLKQQVINLGRQLEAAQEKETIS